jgi:hypothetical protein
MKVGLFGSLRLAAAALLLAWVAVTLPLKAGQPHHVHEAPTAGLYNAEHILATLEFVGGDGPLPDAPAAVFAARLVTPCAAGLDCVPDTAPGGLADSRAPPPLA